MVSYDDNHYDDYECEHLSEEQLTFCDAFDIRLLVKLDVRLYLEMYF